MTLIHSKDFDIGLFEEKFPWIGPDLQTLRDTFVAENIPAFNSKVIDFCIPPSPSGLIGHGKLRAFLDLPCQSNKIHGLVLLLHGLGGSSQRRGLMRMAWTLQKAGFATLRLNLRGALPSRKLAPGTYSAKCNSDLKSVFINAKDIFLSINEVRGQIDKFLPFFGVGLSLGGTILINSCLEFNEKFGNSMPLFKGLACISSPLDLKKSSASIERPRNFFYQKWLLNRLVNQTLLDPYINQSSEELFLKVEKNSLKSKINSIREFDNLITAPRWGYDNAVDYYHDASPIQKLFDNFKIMPQTLFLHSRDDPWVPSSSLEDFYTEYNKIRGSNIDFIVTKKGGHNGFHGVNGCWGDQLVKSWLLKLVQN